MEKGRADALDAYRERHARYVMEITMRNSKSFKQKQIRLIDDKKVTGSFKLNIEMNS